MKNYRSLIIALSVLAFMLICRLAVGGIKVENKYNREGERAEIINILPSDIEEIDFENSEENFTVVHENNAFCIRERENETDKNALDQLISDISKIDGRLLTENCKDAAQYGLDRPKAAVRFTTADKDITLMVGNLTPAETEYYVMTDVGSVYSVYSSVGSRLLSKRWQFMDLTLFTGNYNDITSVSVNGQNGFFAEKQPDGSWKIESEKEGSYTAENEKFRAEVGRYLDNMYAKRLVSNNEEKCAEYGLDAPEGTVTITDISGNKTEFKVSRNAEKKEAAVIKNDGQDIFITIEDYFDMLDIKKENLT